MEIESFTAVGADELDIIGNGINTIVRNTIKEAPQITKDF